ncbi:type II toxin-antitoxin system VapC family toxin (plasmid) [Rhizobium sp. T1470]|uniref:type II toxin-antitoxin system VapC family toxin n=1 Tax=Rhizobium sp. T1470 TaxID=555320 RepID=UPI00296E30E8|nr:type II toxin-antitoxin system VapC family toxin [Rhizobium sp. T1473]
MFLDASAIVAILAGEEDGGYLLAKIEASKKPIFYGSVAKLFTGFATSMVGVDPG